MRANPGYYAARTRHRLAGILGATGTPLVVGATHQKAIGGSSINASTINAYNGTVQPSRPTGDTIHAIDSKGAVNQVQLYWVEDTGTGKPAGKYQWTGMEIRPIGGGSNVPVTFGGATPTEGAPIFGPDAGNASAAARIVASDPINISLAAEQQFVVRECRAMGTTTDWFCDAPGNDQLGGAGARRDGIMMSNTVGSGSVPAGSVGLQSFGPRMIKVRRVSGNTRSFAAIGDSITVGQINSSFYDVGFGDYYLFQGGGGDGLQTTPFTGLISGVLSLGQSGEQASAMSAPLGTTTWADSRWKMLELAQVSDLFLLYGANDILAGVLPATLMANLRTIAQRARSSPYNVQRVIVSTIFPRCVSNAAGAVGQTNFEGTGSGAGSNWLAANTLIRAVGELGTADVRNDPDFVGYIDMQKWVSTAKDVCRWTNPTVDSTDGTHPSNDPTSVSATAAWKGLRSYRTAIMALGT